MIDCVQICNQDEEKIANCRNSYSDQPGNYLSCIMDLKMEVILKPACADFLTKVLLQSLLLLPLTLISYI